MCNQRLPRYPSPPRFTEGGDTRLIVVGDPDIDDPETEFYRQLYQGA